MLEFLVELDKSLFLFFNGLHHPVLDVFFYWVSSKWIWVPFYVLLAWHAYRKQGNYLFLMFVFIAAAVAASDQLASGLIKPTVMRLRPCHDPSLAGQVHLVYDYCGGKYGFISSHAANVFTLLAFMLKLFEGKPYGFRPVLWFWAITVSFSRIYLGAHFPGDIIAGLIVGSLSGNIFARLYAKSRDHLITRNQKN